MSANSSWNWSAFGKHPVASDFFRLGENTPLNKGFADWVERGYQGLGSKRIPSRGLHAWRFWARGTQKENIACGVLRDSSDRVGRPYPLLIIGTGSLNEWEDHWDLMPFACERTWSQIEYLSAFITNDFKKLEQEVFRIRPPHPGWAEFEMRRGEMEEIEEPLSLTLDQPDLIADLKMSSDEDQLMKVNFWHTLIRKRIKTAPNVIFIGGTLDKTCLALFRRPLQTSDFVHLWSISDMGSLPLRGEARREE